MNTSLMTYETGLVLIVNLTSSLKKDVYSVNSTFLVGN